VNPSTALARVVVDELVRGGVREAVLSPGSRGGALAVAFWEAERTGRLRLHLRVDERTAAFLALGLARGSGAAVPVTCTSGTAAANFHPAVLEASHAGVPLLLLTADRPPELRGVGANQTTDQLGLYGRAVRDFVEVGVPEPQVGAAGYWRSVAARALLVASGVDPGPVHLNLAFREPLLPGPGESDGDWVEPLAGRPGEAPWLGRVEGAAGGPVAGPVELAGRVLVVAGDGADPAVAAVAAAAGWPVLAEPSSGLWAAQAAIPGYELLLAAEDWLADRQPDHLVMTGRPTLSRRINRLLATAPGGVTVVPGRAGRPVPRWPDPTRSAARLAGAVVAGSTAPGDWPAGWRRASSTVRQRVHGVLAEPDLPLSGPVAARTVAEAVPEGGVLVVGSSQPIRDLAAFGVPRAGVAVLANRGLAGIDGTVSTAVGVALAHQRAGGGGAVALLGDLTLVHDATGLFLGPQESRPDLTLVVVNDAGGGIFGLLEPGRQLAEEVFERVFAAPSGVDFPGLAAAAGVGYRRVSSGPELAGALAEPPAGVRIVEVPVDRQAARALHDRLYAAAVAALHG
jgi:2-succinyl-5-enolpyruvyl-6-hydroxy-3-cyclohexene-1-carboxylate synthase